jgi:hypothetical protein
MPDILLFNSIPINTLTLNSGKSSELISLLKEPLLCTILTVKNG